MSPEVVHVVSSLNMGGAERFALDLALAQKRAGVTVGVLSLGRPTDVLVPEARAQGLLVEGWDRAARARAVLEARAVHLHNPATLWAVAPLLPILVKVRRGRAIYTRHGAHAFKQARWRILHRYARPFVHQVIFVSEEARQVFAKVHGEFRTPHLVIENGADLQVPVARPPSPDGRVRLGSVGRLVELKGQRRLLQAVASLPEASRARVAVHLFGDGEEREALERLRAEQLADVPVHFHGNVLDREQVYRHVDVLVVASRMEGLSLAIMEAMARCIPVVATDVGGNGRLVLPEQTGLLCAPGDVAALAAALQRMLDAGPEGLARLGQGARRHVEQAFSLDVTARRHLQIYGLA
jgi:glycosyltransferase involved in cell wall biosynthesis